MSTRRQNPVNSRVPTFAGTGRLTYGGNSRPGCPEYSPARARFPRLGHPVRECYPWKDQENRHKVRRFEGLMEPEQRQ
jgi:hypothetical protein